MSHYDVAVIGAGAAGLAAGLAVQKSGRSFIVLEARNRIGGRAFTDTETLPGIPFDRGAHWLHAAAQNPFTAIADRLGVRYKRDIDWSHRTFFTGGGREADRKSLASAGQSLMTFLDACAAAGESGEDVAFSNFMQPDDPWEPLNRRIVHQITSHEPEDCSTRDYARYVEDGGDFPVEDGYGALVTRHADGLPVTLSTPVSGIDWSGKHVKITTPAGTFTATKIVLAVPVNVLAAGSLRFTPSLPPALLQAAHDCPMGCSEKIAILLDRPIEGHGHIYGDIIRPGSLPFNLHVNPFGRPLAVSHLGGTTGRDLVAAGEAAAAELATEAMVFAFGSAIRSRIRKVAMTDWVSDPFSLGGYSHCRPGRADARLAFAEAIGERIFLAGEHCSLPFFSTVHGAHLSGQEAAARAMAGLA